jgi:hypothetical protein
VELVNRGDVEKGFGASELAQGPGDKNDGWASAESLLSRGSIGYSQSGGFLAGRATRVFSFHTCDGIPGDENS